MSTAIFHKGAIPKPCPGDSCDRPAKAHIEKTVKSSVDVVFFEDREGKDLDEATLDGIRRATEHVDSEWSQEAYNAICRIIQTHDSFTADNVWEELERVGVDEPDNKSGMVAPIMRAKRNGLIVASGTESSKRKGEGSHRYPTVTRWKVNHSEGTTEA